MTLIGSMDTQAGPWTQMKPGHRTCKPTLGPGGDLLRDLLSWSLSRWNRVPEPVHDSS
jgi:hypothetical protein